MPCCRHHLGGILSTFKSVSDHSHFPGHKSLWQQQTTPHRFCRAGYNNRIWLRYLKWHLIQKVVGTMEVLRESLLRQNTASSGLCSIYSQQLTTRAPSSLHPQQDGPVPYCLGPDLRSHKMKIK